MAGATTSSTEGGFDFSSYLDREITLPMETIESRFPGMENSRSIVAKEKDPQTIGESLAAWGDLMLSYVLTDKETPPPQRSLRSLLSRRLDFMKGQEVVRGGLFHIYTDWRKIDPDWINSDLNQGVPARQFADAAVKEIVKSLVSLRSESNAPQVLSMMKYMHEFAVNPVTTQEADWGVDMASEPFALDYLEPMLKNAEASDPLLRDPNIAGIRRGEYVSVFMLFCILGGFDYAATQCDKYRSFTDISNDDLTDEQKILKERTKNMVSLKKTSLSPVTRPGQHPGTTIQGYMNPGLDEIVEYMCQPFDGLVKDANGLVSVPGTGLSPQTPFERILLPLIQRGASDQDLLTELSGKKLEFCIKEMQSVYGVASIVVDKILKPQTFDEGTMYEIANAVRKVYIGGSANVQKEGSIAVRQRTETFLQLIYKVIGAFSNLEKTPIDPKRFKPGYGGRPPPIVEELRKYAIKIDYPKDPITQAAWEMLPDRAIMGIPFEVIRRLNQGASGNNELKELIDKHQKAAGASAGKLVDTVKKIV